MVSITVHFEGHTDAVYTGKTVNLFRDGICHNRGHTPEMVYSKLGVLLTKKNKEPTSGKQISLTVKCWASIVSCIATK